jgi:transglutaminase-like putative cysteine protease
MDTDPSWLAPTWFLDSDSPVVEEFAAGASAGATDPTDVAIALFLAVRDGFRYDPYGIPKDRASYQASAIIDMDTAWCVSKSVVLTAAARNRGIPARLGFADVRNHLSSEKLVASMGSDLFIWHGYSELLLDDRWYKLSAAFNIELCDRFGVKVLEFDGTADALMHPFDEAGNRHMEYVRQRGSFDDLPYEEIFADFADFYPEPLGGGATVTSADAAGDPAFSSTTE